MEEQPQDAWPTEAEYLDYLTVERSLFAWTLVRYGGVPPEEAKARALARYPFEPPEDEYRGLIFHKLAWHWAMLQIRGEMYWVRDRDAATPSPEYRDEAERLHGLDVDPSPHQPPGS